MEDFEIGQRIWCVTVNGKIIKGKILDFYPNDDQGPAVSLIDESTGSFRVVLLETCSLTRISKSRKKK